tara:strand:- start:412 stop:840 length:429 start_codon:yes stop_codon:yes gene_type:complete
LNYKQKNRIKKFDYQKPTKQKQNKMTTTYLNTKYLGENRVVKKPILTPPQKQFTLVMSDILTLNETTVEGMRGEDEDDVNFAETMLYHSIMTEELMKSGMWNFVEGQPYIKKIWRECFKCDKTYYDVELSCCCGECCSYCKE